MPPTSCDSSIPSRPLCRVLRVHRSTYYKHFYSEPTPRTSENHLNQQFNPAAPNSVWASGFTYIKVNGSFHYLCVAIDLFSRKGDPYDNACCESFFLHMKRECLGREKFRNQDELRLSFFAYIQRYNTKRPHGSPRDYKPDEIEAFYLERQA